MNIDKLKGALKSKSIWFGTAVIFFGAIQTALPQLQGILTPDTYGLITSIIGGIVVILRWVTSNALDAK